MAVWNRDFGSFLACVSLSERVCVIRGVAKNEHLGGLGCNRNILNIILKSIGYKIINFHISSYTWTYWEFNRNFKHVRNKKIEKRKRQKKNNHMHKTVFTWFGNLPMSTKLQEFPIIKENYNVRLQCFSFSKTTRRQNPNHKKKQLLYPPHRIHNGLQKRAKNFLLAQASAPWTKP